MQNLQFADGQHGPPCQAREALRLRDLRIFAGKFQLPFIPAQAGIQGFSQSSWVPIPRGRAEKGALSLFLSAHGVEPGGDEE